MKIQEQQVPQLYLERQKSFSNLCGVHAINNIIGYEAFSQKSLNQICYDLSNDFINPHKHVFGGDYDANILMIALQRIGYQCKWLDARNKETILQDLKIQNEKRIGYIVNRKQKPNSLKKFFGISDRHWLAVKRQKNQFFQLDSTSKAPKPPLIPDISSFILEQLQNQSHVLEVLITADMK